MFGHMESGWLLLLFAALNAVPAFGATTPVDSTGVDTGVVFSEYSPLSSGSELVRRLFSPLTAMRIGEEAARAGTNLRPRRVAIRCWCSCRRGLPPRCRSRGFPHWQAAQ